MSRIIDLSGQRFGRLVVIGYAHTDPNVRKAAWLCKCDCGKASTVIGTNLTRDKGTRSCGCMTGGKTHGLSKLPEYHVYIGMIARCNNPKRSSYKDYGGRGIKVCKRWLDSPQNFLDDVGRRPADNYSLDRIDPNGDYEPNNVEWATTKQQTLNKRPKFTQIELVKELIRELTPTQLKLIKKFVDKLSTHI